MKNTRIQIFIALTILGTNFQNAFACKVKTPAVLNLAVNTDESQYFSYGIKSLLDEIPYSEVTNCVQTAQNKKFLMIALGPEMVEAEDTYRGTNFNKHYIHPVCKINQNPLENILTASSAEKEFSKKWKYIENCIEVHVTELGSKNIQIANDQEGCDAKIVSPKSAVFKGGYCFFKPNLDSSYNVTVRVAKECTQKSNYVEKEISFQDVAGNISFYTAAQTKGELGGLTAIGTHPIRVSSNSPKEILEPSDDFGILRPTFPISYPVTDLHLGKVSVSKMGEEYLAVKSSMIVDHSCGSVSKNGITSSPCDYAIPVVGEFTLKNEKNETLISWYDGGVAGSQWQGMISGEGIQIPKEWMTPGKKYKIIANFGEPHYDFNFFKGRVKNRIGQINARLPVITLEGEIREITQIKTIEELDQMIEVEPISGLRLRDPLIGLAQSRRRLSGYFTSTMWPPIYKDVCSSKSGKCSQFNSGFANFTAEFEVNSDFEVYNLAITRKSELLGNYKKQVTNQPEYICE